MNRIKKWERGFNQSELIAKWLSVRLNKPYISLLEEKSRYKTQRMLGYRERFLNILDRYKILNIKKISGKNILIIDDVFTTGATINECARIIKSFGAEKVYSLTMARANIKRVELN
jgi:competence protein ComFC